MNKKIFTNNKNPLQIGRKPPNPPPSPQHTHTHTKKKKKHAQVCKINIKSH